jgi:hypothetical protein
VDLIGYFDRKEKRENGKREERKPEKRKEKKAKNIIKITLPAGA